MRCQLLHFNYGTWKFKPWVWAIAPFFPAYLPWYRARAEAALPRETRPDHPTRFSRVSGLRLWEGA